MTVQTLADKLNIPNFRLLYHLDAHYGKTAGRVFGTQTRLSIAQIIECIHFFGNLPTATAAAKTVLRELAYGDIRFNTGRSL